MLAPFFMAHGVPIFTVYISRLLTIYNPNLTLNPIHHYFYYKSNANYSALKVLLKSVKICRARTLIFSRAPCAPALSC